MKLILLLIAEYILIRHDRKNKAHEDNEPP